MKANTNRDGRLNFDVLVDVYDFGRPKFSVRLVEEIAHNLGLGPGARVLEIGAGTGQLTLALVDFGFNVVALEPGANLQDRLRSHLPKNSTNTIVGELFEDYNGSEGSFPAIWAANSFHWIAPDVSYRKAASLLERSGHLVLLWNYPILRHDVQDELNDRVFSLVCPNFIRDPNNYQERLTGETAEGRQELLASEQFEELRYWFTTDILHLGVERYLAMLTSYGHVADMSGREQSQLVAQVRQVLRDRGMIETVEVFNHIYVCIAKKGAHANSVSPCLGDRSAATVTWRIGAKSGLLGSQRKQPTNIRWNRGGGRGR